MNVMAPTRPIELRGCRVRLTTGPAASAEARRTLRAEHPDLREYTRALAAWSQQYKMPRGTSGEVADHIDHLPCL